MTMMMMMMKSGVDASFGQRRRRDQLRSTKVISERTDIQCTPVTHSTINGWCTA